mgnify:CR=1 FL=1
MNDNIIVHITARLFAEEKCYGPGVHRLLGAVAQNHSLRAAAASMNMAYSKAWRIIRTAEDVFGCKRGSSSGRRSRASAANCSGPPSVAPAAAARSLPTRPDRSWRPMTRTAESWMPTDRSYFGNCSASAQRNKKGRPSGRPFCGHQMVGISIPRRRYMVFFTALRMFSYPVQRHR